VEGGGEGGERVKEREPGRQLSHSPRHLRFWTRRVKRSSTQGELFFQACSSCLGFKPKTPGWLVQRPNHQPIGDLESNLQSRRGLRLDLRHQCLQRIEGGRRVRGGMRPDMSSIPPPPREQLCNRYCSNKHTHTPGSKEGGSARRKF